jgi:hypothetical protein
LYRERNPTVWFFISLLASPIVAAAYLFAMPPLDLDTTATNLTDDPIANAILYALRTAGAAGMNRTTIRDQFSRDTSNASIETTLLKLANAGKARRSVALSTDGGQVELWFIK